MPSTVAKDTPSSRLDLVITHTIDAPRTVVWRAWTDPAYFRLWWAPAPAVTTHVDMDLKPGGVFRTVMQTADGAEHRTDGCFLDVVAGERLVFTDTLLAGWRPAPKPFFTAMITLEEQAGATRYTARAMHKNETDCRAHEQMGFTEGWGTCINQLGNLARRLTN